ncbi:hypothetical protein MAPG_10348 [Magnaporthiopsis poae ATCC 64411]|uniref:Uncharacterized protein n=1 Tax=Magnaporthiopsis poae (strain ATCC 64411 / 73-15) TaxID=644358 RepID=A0A0C4ECD0_MAGP6|nr:hypothetical protein MAPG_10348 [Magnaporthiopsis poae ATCC 64411]
MPPNGKSNSVDKSKPAPAIKIDLDSELGMRPGIEITPPPTTFIGRLRAKVEATATKAGEAAKSVGNYVEHLRGEPSDKTPISDDWVLVKSKRRTNEHEEFWIPDPTNESADAPGTKDPGKEVRRLKNSTKPEQQPQNPER